MCYQYILFTLLLHIEEDSGALCVYAQRFRFLDGILWLTQNIKERTSKKSGR